MEAPEPGPDGSAGTVSSGRTNVADFRRGGGGLV